MEGNRCLRGLAYAGPPNSVRSRLEQSRYHTSCSELICTLLELLGTAARMRSVQMRSVLEALPKIAPGC
jgi:hypothetical protein